jgi:hypothetical protein
MKYDRSVFREFYGVIISLLPYYVNRGMWKIMFFFQYKLLFYCVVWEPLGFGRRDGFAGIVLNISFFDATEEGGISFGRTNFF